MAMRIAKASLNFTGLYESELLVELMLRYWSLQRAVTALHADRFDLQCLPLTSPKRRSESEGELSTRLRMPSVVNRSRSDASG